MSMRYLGGFITASYNPLKVPNAPTIGTATAGDTQATITFTAPSNVGASAITSYIAVATKTSDGTAVSATGSASPITITGLTNGSAYTIQVSAVNTYGPGPYSAPSGSVTPVAPKLYAWGYNNFGQLGLGDTANKSSPTQVGALTNWGEISTGLYFGNSVKLDGTLWSWGNNENGQLGKEDRVYRSSPVQVGALTTWSKVSNGNWFTIALRNNGTLWGWGNNVDAGSLGDGTTINRSSPVQIGSDTNWASISANNTSSFAIKTTGTLWAWGGNGNGVLGLNDRVARSSPVQVGALTNWSVVRCGGTYTIAVKTDGTLWGWGQNDNGQLGDGTVIQRSSPVQIGALTTWSKIAAGSATIGIRTDGTIWSWGNNSQGQLGQNVAVSVLRSSPVQIGADTNWSNVSCASAAVGAIRTTGALWSWGSNSTGSLGLSDTINRSSPVQVGSGTGWISLSNGSSAAFFIATSA
jgi:alpha-tubulin suppressor-like RCC1 family protein